MNLKLKILLGILVAALIIGIGYFGVFKGKKPTESPVNVPPKTEDLSSEALVKEEIDTSDWQTYRNEMLGFEIKMPKEWSGGYYLGRRIPDDPEIWQEQVGGADFNGPFSGTSSPQFSLRVKDSDLTLEKFRGSSWEEYIVINDLPAKRHVLDYRKEPPGRRSYNEFIVVKNNKRYFNFEFSASVENMDEDILIWHQILNSFKSIAK